VLDDGVATGARPGHVIRPDARTRTPA
jgi:hypothetical protein